MFFKNKKNTFFLVCLGVFFVCLILYHFIKPFFFSQEGLKKQNYKVGNLYLLPELENEEKYRIIEIIKNNKGNILSKYIYKKKGDQDSIALNKDDLNSLKPINKIDNLDVDSNDKKQYLLKHPSKSSKSSNSSSSSSSSNQKPTNVIATLTYNKDYICYVRGITHSGDDIVLTLQLHATGKETEGILQLPEYSYLLIQHHGFDHYFTARNTNEYFQNEIIIKHVTPPPSNIGQSTVKQIDVNLIFKKPTNLLKLSDYSSDIILLFGAYGRKVLIQGNKHNYETYFKPKSDHQPPTWFP